MMLNPLHKICTSFVHVCTVVETIPAQLAQLAQSHNRFFFWCLSLLVKTQINRSTHIWILVGSQAMCGIRSPRAQERLGDVFGHIDSYYTLDRWAIVYKASLVTTFSLLTSLFVSGNEVCCIQTVTNIISLLCFTFVSHLYLLSFP